LKVVADAVMKKVQWERVQKKNQDIKKQEEEAEKTAMSQIDWHDFVVVQTIEFEDEEEEEEEPKKEQVPEMLIETTTPAPEKKFPEPIKYLEDDVDMDMGEDEKQEEEEVEPFVAPSQIKVKPGFDPRARAGKKVKT
jgi:splicing factor 3A subunit 1